MSCVEKRHINHRTGSMLHHRFPNGFTDLFMDETDREVSTLTDRAFRSLCIGDDAVFNDDFLYGYSPYSCLKPLAGEPFKKNPYKESKKAGQPKPDKSDDQPWKQQQQDNISHMSSFLKVLSTVEERNGGMTDSNGESWDKSALRSIERELLEFSSDYRTSLANRHYKNNKHHQSGVGPSNKKCNNASFPSGKLTKNKNGKSTVKLRKLNIKNFFLHSEFSPFQTWTDLNRYSFGQDNTVTNIISADNVHKWYDLPFYKELTAAHTKEILHTEEVQSYQKEAVESSATRVLEPTPDPPPCKALPKPAAPLAQKRCSSDGGDKNAAPWRRNGPRAKSAIPANQLGKRPQESNSKPLDENMAKKDVKSVEVKAIQEVSSLASTPFSICQLMTPVILSRQPTETSEILQEVISPSILDLLSRPHSEAKVTPAPPVKRETYKSLASSILFNLKDNRKRALKELERARLGDCLLDNVKSKLEVFNIDEEAKAKNYLISRELRNIKKGMLSTKGNTLAKRKIFAEKELSKQEVFAKLDSNVIEEERFPRMTPSSEGIESLPTSTADPDYDSTNAKVAVESEKTKGIKEQSGFICSGNDSQTGLPKPPAVLPKSEKAVQKAIKLTNRRMKKEESQKSQKSSQSSGKNRAEKTSDKSEQKSSGSAKAGRSSEKKHKDGNRHNANHHSNDSHAQRECHKKNHNQNEVHRTWRQSQDSVEGNTPRTEERLNLASERQGRSTDRHARENAEHRDYSSDSVISNVPVYKAHVSERPMSDRPFNRSQSIDRYLGGKVERRLSADLPVSEKLEPRTKHIEKSIMQELQQRSRAKDKPSRAHHLRRSQSIDAYSTEIPPHARQSSHTSQFSHQSSIEHAVLAQSISMTQRKILQDPDSGQYFFVDLPVQVNTKTFFDPGTGSYVQLPVQPPDGGVPSAPHVEVLTSPLVVYHSFVPVPLSPMAQKATIQAAHVEPNGLEQRIQKRARQVHIKDGHPYLEPAYSQHELMLGEFLGTEELDCPC
ncbi:hypothetical protein CRENBAI_015585 [Crenichthys baileyi]|uniref:DUF4585 domain-containing protein n=1 Tax=Crenichthys baileyi TaxID=28760 RepID=A0AAV9R151_9TELE